MVMDVLVRINEENTSVLTDIDEEPGAYIRKRIVLTDRNVLIPPNLPNDIVWFAYTS